MILHRKYVRATAQEKARIDRMMKLGCSACAVIGVPNLVATECHHIVVGNKRLGHWYTIPLCSGHHRGQWSQHEWIQPHERASVTYEKRAFVLIYGTERSQWEKVQLVMHLDNAWPDSKILPRPVLRLVKA